MFITRTDDPLADFDRWEEEKERRLQLFPKCDSCGEHIQDDYCYEVNGELLCEDCLIFNYRRFTEDYMG